MNPRRAAWVVVAAGLAAMALAGCLVQPTAQPGGPLPSGPVSTVSPGPSGSPAPTVGQTTPSPGPTTRWGPLQPDPRLDPFYAQTLRWEACGGGFQCADLTVPLSYDDPGGATIEIAVVRLATRDEDRIGSLVVNPGGPGGSGVDYARAARVIVSPQVLERYDIVGFDPRGVGASDPVWCLTGPQTDQLFAMDSTPDTPTELAEVVTVSKLFGERCQRRAPDLLGRVGTRDAARDLDVLRAALGDRRLYYLGKSYGTYLGATYAELFPQNVGRLVLDGVLPPDLDAEQITLGQAKAFEVVLRRFVEDCQDRADCPLPPGIDAGIERVQTFFAELEERPLPGQPNRPLTEALAIYTVLSYLYFPAYDWPQLRSGLAAAFDGDGSLLLDMLDARIDRLPDGDYATNGTDALYAISCVDRTVTGGAARAEELAGQWAEEAPTFGPYLAWGNLPCSGWPAPATNEPHQITATGAAPILVVSTRYDPATPYEWGVALVEMLDDAALVSYEGDGHTAYYDGSACVDAAVDRYLLTGEVPAADPDCPAVPV